MKKLTVVLFMLLVAGISACSQKQREPTVEVDKIIGGRCEGCEAIHEYGSKKLTWIDTLPDFNEAGQKLMIYGTIFRHDGKTPASDIILYVYHTDQNGQYSRKGNETGWGQRHGYIRGWIKTNTEGHYKFYTLKPGAYPTGNNPSHIHPIIKEPGIQEYWIDDYLFDDDPLLTEKERGARLGRGGNGILKTKTDANGMLVGHRDIVLGLNVPDYE
jgi:protocatechuate 3,4-dioxygenase beta subunit